MSKTKELKKRYEVYAKRESFRLFWKEPSPVRAGSRFSAELEMQRNRN